MPPQRGSGRSSARHSSGSESGYSGILPAGSPAGPPPLRPDPEPPGQLDEVHLPRRRILPYLLVFFGVLLMVGALIGINLWRHGWLPRFGTQQAAAPAGAAPGGTAPAGSVPSGTAPSGSAPSGAASPGAGASALAALPANPDSVPDKGKGTFAFVDTPGAVLGTAGTLKRFRVAVEDGTGSDAAAFAAAVDQVLGDPRGWTAGGQLRFQRVPKSAAFEFTVFLASPATSEQMCLGGGLHTQKYNSCRLGGQIIINLARWLTSVPGYGAPLEVYRGYAINHEVGHELGYGHEACVAPGRPASVMQQQTLGLQGCVANAWPYLDGVRYAGPLIP